MYLTVKNRVTEILDPSKEGDSISRGFNVFIVVLILLNLFAVVLESVKSIAESGHIFFKGFEIFSVGIFTVEYFFRLWACTTNDKYQKPFMGRLRYFLSPFAIIDLIAILPFYLPMLFQVDLRFLRILRLFRIFVLFKIGRYSQSLMLFGKVGKQRKEELLIAFSGPVILLVFSASLMYFVENNAQPGIFSSIPETMWWASSAITRLGSGANPITATGKLLAGLIGFLGLAMFALPTGILASGFVAEIQKRKTRLKNCPHCGKEIDKT